jgi:hypothetical protein
MRQAGTRFKNEDSVGGASMKSLSAVDTGSANPRHRAALEARTDHRSNTLVPYAYQIC